MDQSYRTEFGIGRNTWSIFPFPEDLSLERKPQFPPGTVVSDNGQTAAYKVQNDGSFRRVTPKASHKRIKGLIKKKLKAERIAREHTPLPKNVKPVRRKRRKEPEIVDVGDS